MIDVIATLTNSERPRKYWNDLKKKLINEGYFEVSEKIGQLKMEAPDGKMRETDCANTEDILRIIQSIPSPNAEYAILTNEIMQGTFGMTDNRDNIDKYYILLYA